MIWTAVVLYAAAALALGWRSRGRGARPAPGAVPESRPGEEFWTAGRSLGAGSVGLSISAGFMSVSWSCVYAVQLFYGYGLGAMWLITVPWLLALAGIWWLARRYRGLPAFSQPEMVSRRFGGGARITIAVALAAVFLVWGGAEIYVAATLLAPGLELGVPAVILGIGAVVGAYAALGGFGAVVATDKLQYVLVALYVLTMAGLAAFALGEVGEVGGGGGGASELLGATSGRPWTDWLAPGVATILITLVAYLPGWLFETDLWVRVQAARDVRAARRGVLLAGVNAFFFVGLLPLFIGVAALVLFPLDGGQIPPEVGAEGDAIFAALIERFAPPWLAALATVGLVAAAMSTIDTCANVMALSIAWDLLGRHGESGRAPSAATSRWITVGAVAACCVFALFTESLWDLFYLSGGILTTAVAFPVAAVFLPWASRRGVVASSLAGLAGTVTAYFFEVHGSAEGGLRSLEPVAIADSGLGYILWGLLAAALGYALGALTDRSGGAPGAETEMA